MPTQKRRSLVPHENGVGIPVVVPRLVIQIEVRKLTCLIYLSQLIVIMGYNCYILAIFRLIEN
jgi:hypothetical protein